MNDLYADLPETDKRDRGMALAADTNAEILDWLRVQLVRLYKLNRVVEPGEAFVTADDARKYLEDAIAAGKFERPNGSLNFLGSLFKAPGWETTGGFVKSRTRGSHANRLLKWKWTGQ
jgi:hypothetical protein